MHGSYIVFSLLVCVPFCAICSGEGRHLSLEDIVTNRVVTSATISQAEEWISNARSFSGASNEDLRRVLEAFISSSSASLDRTRQSGNCVMAIRAYSTLTSTNEFAFLSSLAMSGTNAVARAAYVCFCQVAPISQRISFSEKLLDDDLVAAEMKSQVWLEWGHVMAWRERGDAYRESVERALRRRQNHSRDGDRCESILRKTELRTAFDAESSGSEVRARRIRAMRETLIRK